MVFTSTYDGLEGATVVDMTRLQPGYSSDITILIDGICHEQTSRPWGTHLADVLIEQYEADNTSDQPTVLSYYLNGCSPSTLRNVYAFREQWVSSLENVHFATNRATLNKCLQEYGPETRSLIGEIEIRRHSLVQLIETEKFNSGKFNIFSVTLFKKSPDLATFRVQLPGESRFLSHSFFDPFDTATSETTMLYPATIRSGDRFVFPHMHWGATRNYPVLYPTLFEDPAFDSKTQKDECLSSLNKSEEDQSQLYELGDLRTNLPFDVAKAEQEETAAPDMSMLSNLVFRPAPH
ncbi:hypothetical protein BT63DRAFT_456236 [Microthyrium microscopicum]|uniref:Uncharacterized protein n=1 Tax=Microthyrium microscopicum TaxID=703497 RepID=A0A6A6UB96_9PEZI|nr:hypothetical protein BT63DRAFT_456236 [Microthyrium microscopicum]